LEEFSNLRKTINLTDEEAKNLKQNSQVGGQGEDIISRASLSMQRESG